MAAFMDSQDSSVEATELQWKGRLHDARKRYNLAVVQFRQAVSEQKAGLLASPDGFHAVRNALLNESKARSEYIRVLRIVTDLVLYSKIPTFE